MATLFESVKVKRKTFREALVEKTKQGKAKRISFEQFVKIALVPMYFQLYGENFKFSNEAQRFLEELP